jgi:hypothetical protein
MARFGQDCMRRLTDLTKKMEVTLRHGRSRVREERVAVSEQLHYLANRTTEGSASLAISKTVPRLDHDIVIGIEGAREDHRRWSHCIFIKADAQWDYARNYTRK